MPLPRLMALVTATMLALPALAGNVLRVGPTQTYATIDLALSAAVDGDLILVDPGVYPPFQIVDLTITIASSSGAANPFTVQQTPGQPGIQVLNLAIQRTVTILHAIVPFADGSAPAIEIDQCMGSVRLHDVSVDLVAHRPNATARAAIEITACDSVWCESLRVRGAIGRVGNTVSLFGPPIANNGGLSAVLLDDSTATLNAVHLVGFANSTPVNGEAWGGDALRMIGSSYAWVVGDPGLSFSVLEGADGSTYGGSAVHQVAIVTPAGITACGPTTFAIGFGNSPANNGGLHAIDGDRGVVQSGPMTINRTVPACIQETYGSVRLASASLHLGTSTQLSVWSLFQRAYFVVLSDTTAALSGPSGSLQMFHQMFGTAVLLGFGTVASGPGLHSIAIPNTQGLVGLPLTVQAVLGIPAGPFPTINTLSLTLPAMGVIVP